MGANPLRRLRPMADPMTPPEADMSFAAMPAPDQDDSLPRWLKARIRVELADAGRRICRVLRKGGAVHLWCGEKEVRGLLPDTPKSQALLADLAAGQDPGTLSVQGFFARTPLSAWQSPQPECLAPGLMLATAWAGTPAAEDTLVIDPLISFGAGDHPSTRLNLILLHQIRQSGWRPHPGAWLADVGAGSGILALALALMFGRAVMAVDPEPASWRAVDRNRKLNPQAGSLVHFVAGTHACLKKDTCSLASANLPGPILRQAAGCLVGCLKPGGRLVVSGFRAEASRDINNIFNELSLSTQESEVQEGWAGIVMAKKPGPSRPQAS